MRTGALPFTTQAGPSIHFSQPQLPTVYGTMTVLAGVFAFWLRARRS
jgi:hypothetical protein